MDKERIRSKSTLFEKKLHSTCPLIKLMSTAEKLKLEHSSPASEMSSTRIIFVSIKFKSIKVRLPWTVRKENLTSSTTCERFQPVANFASNCLTSLRQNFSWVVGLFEQVTDYSRKLPTFASHPV